MNNLWTDAILGSRNKPTANRTKNITQKTKKTPQNQG